MENCNEYRKKSKLKVVACLSQIIVNDAMNKAAASYDDLDLKSNLPGVSLKCQKEVKFQLLQKHSSIKLNPILVSVGPGLLLYNTQEINRLVIYIY